MSIDFQPIVWDSMVEDDCRQLVRLAVREDLDRTYDWTTLALVDHQTQGHADVVMRTSGVVAGLEAARVVLEEMAPSVIWSPEVQDGDFVVAGTRTAAMSGPARNLLTCERIVLNFLGRLSGIATLTRKYVEAVAGSRARIYDTRKTTPGWRRLEKYAVRLGGGQNHRTGLFDAVLIKDNHLALGATAERQKFSPAAAVAEARRFVREQLADDPRAQMPIEIEVDTLAQLEEVLPARPDIVLLDNMPLDQLKAAVAQRDASAPGIMLEASGGVRLDTVAAIADTGVDRISVGALTHSAISVDIGLDWRTTVKDEG